MHFKNMKTLAVAIHGVRKKQGLTQEGLAAASGVGIRFIRELEQGKESCHMGKAIDVITMLGITLDIKGGGLE